MAFSLLPAGGCCRGGPGPLRGWARCGGSAGWLALALRGGRLFFFPVVRLIPLLPPKIRLSLPRILADTTLARVRYAGRDMRLHGAVTRHWGREQFLLRVSEGGGEPVASVDSVK